MDEYTKPSRHRDRKHDYDRSDRRRAVRSEDAEMAEARRKSLAEQRLRESEDWGGYSEGELDDILGLEPEEESPTTEGLQ